MKYYIRLIVKYFFILNSIGYTNFNTIHYKLDQT
jgi:hypothetical protein